MKLQIGAKGEGIDGFKKLDIIQHGDIDFVQDASDLSNFETESVDEIYASHIIEHFKKLALPKVLLDWNRVLKEGGVLWVSVPDFARIVEMYLKSGKELSVWLDHLLHGDQANPESFHYSSFTFPTLSGYLSQAGFSKIDRIVDLPYGVNDASKITDNRYNIPISLNLKAVK